MLFDTKYNLCMIFIKIIDKNPSKIKKKLFQRLMLNLCLIIFLLQASCDSEDFIIYPLSYPFIYPLSSNSY